MNKFTFIETKNPADITDPSNTLGIEVTIPAVAEKCELGNIDGQHGTGRGSWDGTQIIYLLALPLRTNAEGAAIAIATQCGIPSDGTALVTNRADLDSVGAMAVLLIRSMGLWPAIGTDTEREFIARIVDIANADSFAPSAKWRGSSLPTPENPWPRAGSVDSTRELAHLGMICSPRRGDVVLPLAERVAVIACWLLYGTWMWECIYPKFDKEYLRPIYEACGATGSDSPTAVLDAAAIDVYRSRVALAEEARKPGAVMFACPICGTQHRNNDVDGYPCRSCGLSMGTSSHSPIGIAIIRVAHAGAIGLGYCVAPVVIAFDQANPGKVTIAAYSAAYLDVLALKARLIALEPGWGGGATILGSPQNGGTKLSDDVIVEEVRSCLK